MSAFFPRFAALAALLLCGQVLARVEAPDHVIYGNVTVFGAPAPFGSLIEARAHPSGALVARYELGRDPRLGNQFALHIPMDTVDPRRDGYARPGDPLRIYVGTQLAAETSVGAEGIAVRLNLDPQSMGAGPSVIVDDASVFEGHGQPHALNFPVQLNTTSAQRVDIEWSTANGTAVGGASCQAGIDYVTDDGVAQVAAGQLQTTIPVLICGETAVEPDETFVLNLTRVVNGVPSRTAITGTILDDDDVPTLSVDPARVAEPATGNVPMAFRARLSRSSPVEVRFQFSAQGQEALAGADFVATSGTATIAAGALEATINVAVLADGTVESPERLRLELSQPEHVTLAQTSVFGTIDDPAYQPLIEHDGDTLGGSGAITALVQPSAVLLSPDDAYAYVASESGNRVLQFARGGDGALTLLREYSSATPGFANALLGGARDLALSPDGAQLYVAAAASNAISVFARDPGNGELALLQTQLDEQADANAAGGTVRGLQGVAALTVSPDGRHLYAVGATDNSLAVFARDPATGNLRFLEAETNTTDDASDAGVAPVALDRPADVVVSPDGANVYVAARFGDALLTFTRDAAGSSAGFGKVSFVSTHRDGQLGIEGLAGAFGLAIDASGAHLYVASEDDNAVVLFDRGSGGALTRRRQWTKGDNGVPALGGAQALTLSPDGEELYVASFADNSVTAFKRTTPAQGAIGNPSGNLTPRQTLIDGDGDVTRLAGPVALVVSGDGRHLYVAANVDNAIVRFERLSVTSEMFSDGFED